jgi:hypothetical protein
MSFVEEIRKLQLEKPKITIEVNKRIEENQFRDDCIALNKDALLKLYEKYKDNLRNSCQEDSLFASDPSLGYYMWESVPISNKIIKIMKDYFEKDGFIAVRDAPAEHGCMGPYTTGFYLKIK